MTVPRLLLVDDQQMMLEGLIETLRDQIDVVGTVKDGQAAVQAAQQLAPDLTLLDISMPGMNGLEVVRKLRLLVPECKILFLSMHSNPMYAAEAFRAGGAGSVCKGTSAPELIAAIKVVLEGKPYISPLIIKDRLRPFFDGTVEPEAADELSSEEKAVLRMMAEGRSATEIAEGLGIPVHAAVWNIAIIIELLGLHLTLE